MDYSFRVLINRIIISVLKILKSVTAPGMTEWRGSKVTATEIAMASVNEVQTYIHGGGSVAGAHLFPSYVHAWR